jgi:hypothetical protein
MIRQQHRLTHVGVDDQRQLDERQRISRRLPQHPRTHRRNQISGVLVKQNTGRLIIKRSHPQFPQTRSPERILATLPHRYEQHNRIDTQTPRDKHQNIGRGPIEPLRIVSDQHQRTLHRGVTEKIKCRQRNQEKVRGRRIRQSKGSLQRPPMR